MLLQTPRQPWLTSSKFPSQQRGFVKVFSCTYHSCQYHRRPTFSTPTLIGSLGHSASVLRFKAKPAARKRCCRTALGTTSLVNVDFSPSLFLGVGMVGAGVALYQIRAVKPWISKDFDVLVACVSVLVGGILIFQGWRLDPLLLLGQLLTAATAVSFAVEALRLRTLLSDRQAEEAERPRRSPQEMSSRWGLPPPDEPRYFSQWNEGDTDRGWGSSRMYNEPGRRDDGRYTNERDDYGASRGYNEGYQQQPSSADRYTDSTEQARPYIANIEEARPPQQRPTIRRQRVSDRQPRWGQDPDVDNLEDWN